MMYLGSYDYHLSYNYHKMKVTINLILLLTFTAILTQTKLYQVVSVLTPGARYHINDLYDGAQTKAQWGQITPVGLRQMQNLGQAIRKDYIQNNQLLSPTFNKAQFQLISHYSNRSIQTGLAFRSGLYPLGNGQKLLTTKDKYHLPPYSYSNDIQEQNYALPEGQLIHRAKFNSTLIEDCPNQNLQKDKNIRQQLDDYNEMILTYTPFLKKIANSFKIDPISMNFTKLTALYDTIAVDRYLGRPLPTELTSADLTNLQHLAQWYQHFTVTRNLSRAYSTGKLNYITDVFDARSKSPEANGLKWTTLSLQKVDVIAAHSDLNISSAKCLEQLYRKGSTSALNCQWDTSFASSLLFELHSSNAKDFTVRIRYNGKYINLCEIAQKDCSYIEWKSRIKLTVLQNPGLICGKPKGQFDSTESIITTE